MKLSKAGVWEFDYVEYWNVLPRNEIGIHDCTFIQAMRTEKNSVFDLQIIKMNLLIVVAMFSK